MDFNIIFLIFFAVLLVFCVGPMLLMRRRHRGDQLKPDATKRAATPPEEDTR